MRTSVVLILPWLLILAGLPAVTVAQNGIAESATLDLRYQHDPEAAPGRPQPSPRAAVGQQRLSPTTYKPVIRLDAVVPAVCDERGRHAAFGVLSTGVEGCESGMVSLFLTFRNR